MRRKDHIFYSQLFVILFILAVIVRMLLMFAGIKLEVPYLDQAIMLVWRIIGYLFVSFSEGIAFKYN